MLSKIKQRYLSLNKPVRASVWFAICSFVQRGLSFVTVPIFTRLMSVEQYGLYSLYLSWDSVIIVFATLNLSYQVFNNGLIKYKDDQAGYTVSMLGLSNVCTTALFIAYLVAHDFINEATGLTTPLFILMFLQYYFSQALALWTVKERFFYRYRALVAITIISAVASSVIGVVAVYIAKDKVLARVASIVLVNIVVGSFIYIYLLRRSRRIVQRGYWIYALKLDLPLIPHYLSMTVLNSSARILINNICGAAYTALYSVSYNIAAVLNLLNTSINSSYIPWFYKKMAAGEHGEISKVSTALLIVVGACSLLPALFGPEVVLILGSARYMEGVWIMPSAALGVYFTFLYSIFSNYELFFEESKAIMVASLMAAAFNILLNIIFLPVFGFVAAGYAALICYISLAFFHYLMARHISKQRANGIFPFDMQSIVIVSAALLLLSIGVQLTYFNTAIRYVAILIVAVTMFLKREVLLDTIKGMKRGER